VIPDDMFLSSDELTELWISFLFLIYRELKIKIRLNPVIQNGTISLLNEDKTFYKDAAAFPWNSGGPVFIKPFPMWFGPNHIDRKITNLKFIGVMGESYD
jgi:hypothetical protein